jgi:hypothetical protein
MGRLEGGDTLARHRMPRTVVLTPLVAAALAVGATPARSADLAFTVPPGYAQQRQGDVVILAPANPDPHACIYGLAGRHAATGALDTAAEAALVQLVVPGWRRLDDRHAAMRGTAVDGWPYAWYRAAFEGQMNGQRQVVNAMAMVLPAGAGQVHVVWGMGSISRCLLDDATFDQLFQSLRPAGWTPDGGQALTRALIGTWRFSAGSGVGMQQLTFRADGRYARDLGSRTRLGVTERTSATATDGRFVLRNGQLVLTPDQRPGDPDRYRVRIFEEWIIGGWKPSLTLADGRTIQPGVAQYYRVDP